MQAPHSLETTVNMPNNPSEQALSEEEFLANYDASKWPHPALTADIVIFRESDNGAQVLLVRRGNHPYKDCWALPGGFAEPGETIEQVAVRELREETGIEEASLQLLGVYSEPGRDPRDWVVTVAYVAPLPTGAHPVAGDDAAAVQWFEIDEALTLPNLAFDHNRILSDAWAQVADVYN